MTASPARDASVPDFAGLVGLDRIRAAAETLRGVTAPDAARRGRAAGSRPLPQGRVAPADRRVQAARGVRRDRLALAGRAGPGRHHVLVGQPRPGRRPGRPAPRRAGRRRHALGRAATQGPPGGRATAPRSSSSARPARSGGPSPSGSPPSAASTSSRPTTTTGSSPARAPAASRSSRTCPTSRPSSCRSAAAGSSRASPRRSGPSARRPGSSASSRSSRPTRATRSSPAGSSSGRPSWSAGRSPTGRGRRRVGRRTFAHIAALVDRIVTVSEAEIAAAVRLAAEEARLVVEPSGALSIAALRFRRAEAGLDGHGRPGRRGRQRRQRRPGPLPRLPRGADPRLSGSPSRGGPRASRSRGGGRGLASARSRSTQRSPPAECAGTGSRTTSSARRPAGGGSPRHHASKPVGGVRADRADRGLEAPEVADRLARSRPRPSRASRCATAGGAGARRGRRPRYARLALNAPAASWRFGKRVRFSRCSSARRGLDPRPRGPPGRRTGSAGTARRSRRAKPWRRSVAASSSPIAAWTGSPPRPRRLASGVDHRRVEPEAQARCQAAHTSRDSPAGPPRS